MSEFRQHAQIDGLPEKSNGVIRSVILACAIGFGLALAITHWWSCGVC